MCGILGIAADPDGELLRPLLEDLRHRGPDGDGVYLSPELSLGHRRLAIIGLDDGGRQPMWSRSRESLVTFNGEIYNYLELADELEREGRAVDRRYDTVLFGGRSYFIELIASSTQVAERLQRRGELPEIATAEQVEVIQHMIELVQRLPFAVARRQWPGVLVSAVKRLTKAAEKARHGQIGFAVAVVDGGIEDDRLTIRRRPVAAPEITVQQ